MAKHAIVRLDRVTGTVDTSKLLSARFYDGSNKLADVDNGNVVHIENIISTTDREVFKVTAPTAADTIKTIGLVATVELDTDGCVLVTGLDDFYNRAGRDPLRVYLLETGDIFSVTEEAINGLPTSGSVVGKFVKLGTTTKWEYSATDSGAIAVILDVEVKNGKSYYVFRIL